MVISQERWAYTVRLSHDAAFYMRRNLIVRITGLCYHRRISKSVAKERMTIT